MQNKLYPNYKTRSILIIFFYLGILNFSFSQNENSLLISFQQAEKLFENEKYEEAKTMLLEQLENLEEADQWKNWWSSLNMIFDCDYYLANNFLETSTLFEKKELFLPNLTKENTATFYRVHAFMLYSCGDIQASIDKETNAILYLKETKDTASLISAYDNLSVYHAHSNDHKSAIKYGKEVLKLLKADNLDLRINMLKKNSRILLFRK